jgi:U3 small nucleolar RNA-associated protein 6
MFYLAQFMLSGLHRYYEYEWKLEQLRRCRRKARGITGKRSLADYGLLRRIHFIFDRATRKFKGNLSVWMAWLEFCKSSRSSRQVSKVVTRALKLHPTAPFLWAYAAAWCGLSCSWVPLLWPAVPFQ